MTKCCVHGCKSNSRKKEPGISYHRLPSNLEARNVWIKNIGRDNWCPIQRTLICSLHFEESCINRTYNVARVRDDCVPTIFPVPNKSQSQKKNKDQKKQQYNPFQEYANDSTDEDLPEIKQEESDREDTDEDEAEKGALVTERVFVKSIPYQNKPEDGDTQSKRARMDTSEVSFDYTEELYEFGKYVAEQLLCLDAEEARVAQKEIREVLSKFLMNRRTRCFAGPSTSNAQRLRDEHCTPAVVQVNPVASSIPKSRITVNPETPVFSHVNIFGPTVEQSDSQKKTARSSATQSSSQKKTARSSANQSRSQRKTARTSVTPSGSQKKTARSSVPQTGSQKKTARSSVTQSGSQENTAGLQATQSSPQINIPGPIGQSGLILQPALTKFAVLNANPSESSTPQLGYVIVPAGTGPGFNLTQLGNTERPILTQFGSLVTQSGSLPVIPARTPITQSGSSNMIICGTPVKKEPVCELSHSAGNVVPTSVEVKHEPDSEEET